MVRLVLGVVWALQSVWLSSITLCLGGNIFQVVC